MNDKNVTYQASPASSTKMLRAMVGIGIACALLIVLTYVGTLPRIERLKAEALEKAIFKVIPGITSTKTFKLTDANAFSVMSVEEEPENVVYAGYDENNQLVGLAVEARGQGYADIISILYGYDPKEQTVIGFYVLESKETPGLGDKIEKDADFLANFEALSVSLTEDQTAVKNTIVTVKQGTKENSWEVDGITGATISTRAIGDIIGASTQQWVPLLYQNQEAFSLDTSGE